MEHRSYRLRGTPDCPISVYTANYKNQFSHWHPEVEILMVFAGSLHYRLDDRDIILNAGDILVINPNQFHCSVSHTKGRQHVNVIFSLEAISMAEDHIFQKNFVAPLSDGRLQLPNLLQPDHPAYEAVASAMQRISIGNLYLDDSKLQRYAQVMTMCIALQPYCILTRPKDQRQSPEDRTVRMAMLHIHNKYAEPLTLEQIAAHVHLHPNYLCNIFKKQTGHTVMEHLARTRVDAAKFLLRRDALPMARVAELSGFSSERTFFRQFQMYAGMTPKSYQKEQYIQKL